MRRHWIHTRLWFLILVSLQTELCGQIVRQAVFTYEFVDWGDKPSEIQKVFGLTWFRNHSNTRFENLGSGRDDVTPFTAKFIELGVEIFVTFEFANADSGLVCVSLYGGGLPPLYTVPDEFIDQVWDTNMGRFGDPSGGKWIPLVGESKEWKVGDVFIRMIRARLPFSGVSVKYVLQDSVQMEKSGQQNDERGDGL